MPRSTAVFSQAGKRDLLVPVQPTTRVPASDFEALYTLHYRDVYRYLLGLTRSPDEADDIAAETFERAFRAWIGGHGPLERPLPWLLLIARRVATDQWRRARRFARLPHGPDARRTDVASVGRTEFWLWFDAVARVLSPRQREVLLLRYQRDLTDPDIASIMGISESGIRSLVARALAVLRAHPELLS
jgi:RNA polymerase sigma-70 factor (ECF subfamily)